MSCLSVLLLSAWTSAADWPTWRHDATRSAQSPEELAGDLHLQWSRQYPPLAPAFRNKRLQFDSGYEPVVLGKALFFGSSRNDRITALDTETGRERWRFYAGGPLRFAPVAFEDKVYFGADDGHLYCLSAGEGKLLWRFRAVPSKRMLLGNRRLMSVWPLRGGPVLTNGRIYFAAGVWPSEGIFVYCLDAETGDTIWLNDRTGSLYGQHPHGAEAFGGLSPQGYLVTSGDELIVPCGSALPARFDLRTGKLVDFNLPRVSRRPGGWFAAVSRSARRGEITVDSEVNRDRHEDQVYEGPRSPGIRSAAVRSLISVGGRELRFGDGWSGVRGEVHSMLAADGKLFVVTRDGELSCFAAKRGEPKRYPVAEEELERPEDEWAALAGKMLRATAVRHGHALAWGVGSGRLVEELALRSELQVIACDGDEQKVDALRRRWDEAGLYGTRISLHEEPPSQFGVPPFVASLVVLEDATASGEISPELVGKIFHSLRPFGGVACFAMSSGEHRAFAALVARCDLANAEVRRTGDLTLLLRRGALPGSTDYTGSWKKSPDDLVQSPFGVLWFDDTLGHFKRSPQPWFVGGVMISYPKAWLSGDKTPYKLLPATFTDVYTGRVLSPGETANAGDLPQRDRGKQQPVQYRPPSQKDAWKPEPPQPGRRTNPLTGVEEPRTFPKSYGCDGGFDYGHVFTMRSGTAALYDKRIESGTIHISGPRSGCTNSIIPANGLLNVPYFYEGCTCSYPLPAGLAMVSMAEEYEQWTAWGSGGEGKLQRVGINFGAPGDRMTDAGTLWLDTPSIGGPSPEIDVHTEPETPEYFYRHSLWIQGGRGWPWVAASGAKGLGCVTVKGLKSGSFAVRLYFTEPDETTPGRRVFDVALQGNEVLTSLDIFRESGGRLRGLVREFRNTQIDGILEVALTARVGLPLLSGIEIVAAGLPLGEIPVLSEQRPAWPLAR